MQDSTLHYIVLQYFFNEHGTSEKYGLVILYSAAQFEFSHVFLLIDWSCTFGVRNIREVIVCFLQILVFVLPKRALLSQFIVSRRYMMLICLITSDSNFYTCILKCHIYHFSFHLSQNICLWQNLRRKNQPKRNYLKFTDLLIRNSYYIRTHSTVKDPRGKLWWF